MLIKYHCILIFLLRNWYCSYGLLPSSSCQLKLPTSGAIYWHFPQIETYVIIIVYTNILFHNINLWLKLGHNQSYGNSKQSAIIYMSPQASLSQSLANPFLHFIHYPPFILNVQRCLGCILVCSHVYIRL